MSFGKPTTQVRETKTFRVSSPLEEGRGGKFLPLHTRLTDTTCLLGLFSEFFSGLFSSSDIVLSNYSSQVFTG